MDNLTHTLVGIALSRAFFKKRTAYATTALIFAANAPDLDIIGGLRGIAYLARHRALTHSLIFLPVWTIAIAFVLRWATRRRARRDSSTIVPGWGTLLAVGLVGVGSHLLLDLTNSYGIRILYPLNTHWYAWDISPIIDPWLWLILFAFLLLPMLFGLLAREVSSGLAKPRYQTSALLGLLAVCGWWGLRAYGHARALTGIEGRLYGGEAPLVAAAMPTFGSPWRWGAIVETSHNDWLFTEDAHTEARDPDAPEQELPRAPMSNAIRAVEQTHPAKVFLNFSRFPWIEVLAQPTPNGLNQEVILTDLRFYNVERGPGMALNALVNPGNQVVSEHFQWRGAGERLKRAAK